MSLLIMTIYNEFTYKWQNFLTSYSTYKFLIYFLLL
jgi:hypothetical protein